jgi:hypothetical protein
MRSARVNRQSIWLEEQNKPSLIVKDLTPYVNSDIVYETLLRRGVFKWLSVRRKLIRLKNVWKSRIIVTFEKQKICANDRNGNGVHYWRGYRKAMEECRADVRALCHGPRWDCPDIDEKAQRWLNNYEINNTNGGF